jgi:hypothetical protein
LERDIIRKDAEMYKFRNILDKIEAAKKWDDAHLKSVF